MSAAVLLASALLVVEPAITDIGSISSEAQAASTPTVKRIATGDRYAASVELSKTSHPDGADVVYVIPGHVYNDAPASVPAAVASGAPLLVVAQNSIPTVVSSEIARLRPGRIVVVGGEASVSTAAYQKLSALAPIIERVAGADRFHTSRLIASRAFDTAPAVYLASGLSYTDGYAVASAAGVTGRPIVLVKGDAKNVDRVTLTLLAKLRTSTVLLAGPASSVSAGIAMSLSAQGFTVKRIAGADSYRTAVVANTAFKSATRAFLANGAAPIEGIAAAAAAATLSAPLYPSPATCVPDAAKADMQTRLGVTSVSLVGGTGHLDANVAKLVDCKTVKAQQRSASQSALSSKIQTTLGTIPGWYTVSVRQLSGLKASVDVGTRAKEPASTIKLFAAYAALKRVDQRTLSLSTRLPSGVTVGDCMRVMIHVSDNPCHLDLIRYLGADTMNALFAKEGYSGTHYTGNVGGRYYSSKTSSAKDLAVLLARLHDGTLLSASSSNHLIGLMKSQIWRSRLASGIPSGVTQASKPGELWRSNGMIQADTAIVYAPKGTYVVTVLGDQGATKPGIAAISRTVYSHFNGSFGAAKAYPVLNMTTKATVNLRNDPGGPSIMVVGAGTNVEVVSSSRLSYFVKVNGRQGYIAESQLKNRY